MLKRIKVWPHKGGKPIEIFESDKSRFVEKGWLESDPAVEQPAAETATISDETEVTENGDTYGKRRNSKSRKRVDSGDPFV